MQDLMKQLNSSRRRLGRQSSPKEWDQVIQRFLQLLHVWGLELGPEVDDWGDPLVRVKDSGRIEELDDNDEDSLSNTSSTTSNSKTYSTPQEGIGTSTRRDRSNTVQSRRPQATTLEHRQTEKTQAQSKRSSRTTNAEKASNRRSDSGTARNAASQSSIRTGNSGAGTMGRAALDTTTTTLDKKARPSKAIGARSAGSKPRWR
ncbi:hypothetical protein VNI00_012099 [Paramarasmius palmivorus]|uniref:Uncharacterized protein n=1 Tax=Paramarasmius palmivorus TaxID=297713 RepID=A0AAW0C6U3_9AGAR